MASARRLYAVLLLGSALTLAPMFALQAQSGCPPYHYRTVSVIFEPYQYPGNSFLLQLRPTHQLEAAYSQWTGRYYSPRSDDFMMPNSNDLGALFQVFYEATCWTASGITYVQGTNVLSYGQWGLTGSGSGCDPVDPEPGCDDGGGGGGGGSGTLSGTDCETVHVVIEIQDPETGLYVVWWSGYAQVCD